ncbi:MAG: rod shape-determining protein MreC [Planctomycetes bacterium]|nr:rod shape-determining protein MreC [Planctomycetota bacterium]
MWQRLKTLRAELLLALSLLLPVLAPRAGGLGMVVLSGIAPVLPAAASGESGGDSFREMAMRLVAENADLRDRLLALGEPARLVARDAAFAARRFARVEAGVLARDASLFRGSLLIGAGIGEGLAEGQPVVVGEALVGVIAEVGPLASRVRLLTDPGCRAWAGIVSGPETAEGFIEGTGDGVLEMRLVRAGGGREGDPVFTVPADERVPRGLFVGTVRSADDVDRDGVAEIVLDPALPAARIRVVNVLVPGGS